MNLLTKIKSKNFTVGIIGLGYVGLPLAYAFSSKNIKTLGFDINLKQTKMLNNKKSYLKHIPDEKISQMISNGFKATSDFKNIKDERYVWKHTPDTFQVIQEYEKIQKHDHLHLVISKNPFLC